MICVSVVSHGHDHMLQSLLDQLLKFPEVTKIILTFNIVAKTNIIDEKRIFVLNNKVPKGFGCNHNEAFKFCNQRYFCVLNPDVEFKSNPFSRLLLTMNNTNASLIAPKVVNSRGELEVNARKFPSLGSLTKKLLSRGMNHESYPQKGTIYPDWVAGIFMLIKAQEFQSCGGFNEAYFLYYEDVELCDRLQRLNKKIVADMDSEIIHDGQRTSHKNLRYAKWHLMSMCRYLLSTYKRNSALNHKSFLPPDLHHIILKRKE